MTRYTLKHLGFTIVELLVAIVVVGILITIITVSYLGVAKRAAGERMKSDLMVGTTSLAKFKTDKGVYPETLRCDIPDSATNLCIKTGSADTTLVYTVNTSTSPDTYGLTAIKAGDNDISYRTVNGSEPIPCPVGYIVVPGSKTYNTSSFCVMKYEAKIKGNNEGGQTYSSSFVPESRASGTPWVNINQDTAIAESKTACEGCHLISEAEWMTLVQNLLSNPLNWSGGAVGNGHVYRGHSDNNPPSALDATADKSDDQKRTLVLTNGEVIWDLSGNAWEWTSSKIVGGTPSQPGVSGGGYSDREYISITNDNLLPVNIFPVGTGLSGANTWTNSSNHIGTIFSNKDDASLRGFIRGGNRDYGASSGLLALNLSIEPSFVSSGIGFRVTR